MAFVNQNNVSKNSMCLIPARKGSIGLPGKNYKSLAGKPLISWTIECAISSGFFDLIAISTNDEEIRKVSNQYDVLILDRPENLASDTALASEYLRFHSELILEYKYFFLLQPTSPLREISDLLNTYEILKESTHSNVSVISMYESNLRPSLLYNVAKGPSAHPFFDPAEKNRQNEEKIFVMNGAIFASTAQYLRSLNFDFKAGNIYPLIMPEERSIDIDTQKDWEEAHARLDGRMQ